MGLAHSPRIVTDGLVLCLDAASKRSYPGTGTTWTDLVTSAQGSFVNGTSFSGNNSGVISFDGTNDYVDTGVKASSFHGSDGSSSVFTTSFFVNVPSSFTGSSYTSFTLIGNSAGGGGRWILNLNNIDSNLYVGYSLGNSNNSGSTNTLVPHSQWSYITYSYGGGSLKIYLNGVLSDTISKASFTPNSGNNVRIGGHANNIRFMGDIASVTSYNRALTADEIRRNYLSKKERFA